MEKQFIPYNLALKLKELGFNEPCFKSSPELKYPLWQQAFDWFREKHNYNVEISYNSFSNNWLFTYYKTNEARINREVFYNFINYEEAKQACLEKLIEICQEQKEELEQKI